MANVVFRDKVLLAENIESAVAKLARRKIEFPKGWWVSEKFDGYRAVWNGQSFVSRTNKPYHVPVWFAEKMPKSVALDGELWLGRNAFEACGIFRKKNPVDDEWKDVKYQVFDVMNINGQDIQSKPFEERQRLLKDIVSNGKNSPIEITEQLEVETKEQYEEMFNSIVRAGGEGIMLRQPNSPYECKRSLTLLKMKVVRDMECRIVGYKMGTGKYSGKLGSFRCCLLTDEELVFHVSGMTDKIRDTYETSHPCGTVITIAYNDVTATGVPRHPRYIRIRNDR